MKVSAACALCSSHEKGLSWGSAYGKSGFLLLPSRKSYRWKETPSTKLEQGDIICNKCVNKHEHEPMYTVCDLCFVKHEPLFGEKQGWYCSSFVKEEYISGEYGSRHDDERFYFTKNRPDYLKLDHNICDRCIESLVKEGICRIEDN